MSPRKSLAIALAVAALTASAAHAAITFFEAEVGFAISPQPEYLAVADMNSDGLDDLIVISPQSDEVNVLLSAPDQPSGFSPVSVDSFGSSLRRGTVGDVTRDGNADLVVPDQRQDGVWVLQGNGQGRLLDPNFFAIGRNPFAVAIADFDGVRGADIAVTDARLGNVTILLNDGGTPPRFTRGPIFAVGESPETIVTVDANDDGDLDIVTLNVGGPRVKSISVLIFDTVRAGLPVFFPAENFGVGERPESLNVADVNNDGLDDLLMINRPTGGGNSDVNIMTNRGDGVFIGPTLFEVPCPFFTGGATCRSRSLTTGDYDNNGTIDIAVFLTDPRRVGTGSGIENDALLIFPGRGDGQFVSGPVLRSPKIPRSSVSLNLNGDDLIDLAAGFQRNSNITSFVNASTAGDRGNGESCVVGGECFSGICVEGVCCATTCNDNESCAILRREGTCQRVAPDPPIVCDFDEECFDIPNPGDDGTCVDGFCCEARCDVDERCDVPGNEGLCIPTLSDGSECLDEPDCSSGFCVDNTCCREACTVGFCGFPDGVCRPPLDLGEPCQVDGECASDICDEFDGICCDDRCDPETQRCSADGECEPQPEPGELPLGEFCIDDIECESRNCVNEICCSEAECGEGELCLPPNGNCAPEPTPTATPVPRENGEDCDSDSLCISGICEDFVCCEERCDDLETEEDPEFFCAKPDGVCVEGTPPPTPTATPIEVCRDIPCRDDEECVEDDGRGVCVDECDVEGGLCGVGETCVPVADGGEGCVDSCEEINCKSNETCVIGNSGNPVCAIPCGVGTFCEPGEVCQQGELGQPLCISSSRSGGCTVTGRGSATDLVVLMLLPLALLGARRFDRLRGAVVRSTRK